MSARNDSSRSCLVPALAVACGLTIAAVDNFASGGEVSPIVVVALLLVASAVASP